LAVLAVVAVVVKAALTFSLLQHPPLVGSQIPLAVKARLGPTTHRLQPLGVLPQHLVLVVVVVVQRNQLTQPLVALVHSLLAAGAVVDQHAQAS
jgi:predicted membrane-bound dolichyl-phosphate-mannose-protein mannosyltransferase